ncbi:MULTISPECIES: beta-ketoacyl-[acyl-carrier-protein] synthase family protein [unclassified Chryseobacterium]|uniref:beta-ketoacyl-[acyl-carrier-protein] synthase family protein n=1 Tax=unclassified Chryseobacterium TaxID=2593645 RepID=UPI000D3AFB78|nr:MULTISPECIES: beta-ketoacyl-[acyl-carrier-protein] synthase family protein [unclassified Chryseobacterium]PTT35804.1 beta-ketoacyl-[acyl-carrier-protein] synthase family protein [Chryseobacterium sp. HMWF028]PTT75375.1 beta-ketoacyl-[acyl-carrier-protein] synthase family protein [Chryseobacterium sp. HMWF001]PVV61181.1 beta-ketoacyl-[acyl-carrier-protein] synthase family protein [Chryseobacterium sp. HMWF035]
MNAIGNRRIVVTGIGMLSSLGKNKEEHVYAMTHHELNTRNIKRFDVDHKFYRNNKAFCIDQDFLKEIAKNDKTIQFSCAVYSIEEAVKDAQLSTEDMEKSALIVGSSIGSGHSFTEYYKEFITENKLTDELLALSSHTVQTITGDICKHFGIRGLSSTISTACSASANSIGRGLDLIKTGKYKTVIAGGVDIFSELAFSGFNCLQALSKTYCTPFSKTRDGLMLGDGAVFLVLEDYDHAVTHNKKIYSEVLSYYFMNEAHHPTALKSDGSTVYNCMKGALKRGGVTINDVNYINAHGTATPTNDGSELLGISRLLYEKDKKNSLFISSTKSQTGHCLGAAGAIEAALTILAMNNSFVPPNLLPEEHDLIDTPENVVIPRRVVNEEINIAISNSFAFGGCMTSLILKKN